MKVRLQHFTLQSQMDSPVVLLLMTLIYGSTALQQDVQVKLGEDVTLQCQISTEETISVLKWSRPDLNTDGYVYFYRNRRFYENYQHPSFHGRVKLRNPEMKDGDVSLILKNVTFNDTGMYECHIAVRNSGSSSRAHTEISHFINLRVTGETHAQMLGQQIVERRDGNMDDGEAETWTVLITVVAAVIGFLAFLIFIISKKPTLVRLTEAADLTCSEI